MLDAVARDQLRTFIAAADEGSFSAAGRKLRRAQSVISQTLRTRRASSASIGAAAGPVLTAQGQVLPAHARTVAGDVDRLKAHARSIAQGLEPELSIAVDVMFPMGKLNGCDGVSCRFSAHPPAEHAMIALTLVSALPTAIPKRSPLLHDAVQRSYERPSIHRFGF